MLLIFKSSKNVSLSNLMNISWKDSKAWINSKMFQIKVINKRMLKDRKYHKWCFFFPFDVGFVGRYVFLFLFRRISFSCIFVAKRKVFNCFKIVIFYQIDPLGTKHRISILLWVIGLSVKHTFISVAVFKYFFFILATETFCFLVVTNLFEFFSI